MPRFRDDIRIFAINTYVRVFRGRLFIRFDEIPQSRFKYKRKLSVSIYEKNNIYINPEGPANARAAVTKRTGTVEGSLLFGRFDCSFETNRSVRIFVCMHLERSEREGIFSIYNYYACLGFLRIFFLPEGKSFTR